MHDEQKNINDVVMNQIKEGKIKMKPKIYFILGSLISFLSVIFSLVASIYLVSLVFMSTRSVGYGRLMKIQALIDNFPWVAFILSLVFVFVGLFLVKRYNFSYKLDFKYTILVFIASVLISGYVIDYIGLTQILSKKGLGRGMMNKKMYQQELPPNNLSR